MADAAPASAADGWSADIPADLRHTDDARYAAMMAGDVPALSALLADALVYTHSDGKTDDKASYLQALTSGALRYQHYQRGDTVARSCGDTALMHGTLRLQALLSSQPVDIRIHYLAVWTRDRRAQWQLAAWSSTRLATLPPPAG